MKLKKKEMFSLSLLKQKQPRHELKELRCFVLFFLLHASGLFFFFGIIKETPSEIKENGKEERAITEQSKLDAPLSLPAFFPSLFSHPM